MNYSRKKTAGNLLFILLMLLLIPGCESPFRQDLGEAYFIRYLGLNDGMTTGIDILTDGDGDFYVLGTKKGNVISEIGVYLKEINIYGMEVRENLLPNLSTYIPEDMEWTKSGKIITATNYVDVMDLSLSPMIVQCSKTGEIDWQYTYFNDSARINYVKDLTVMQDGALINAGSEVISFSVYPLLFKTTENGILIWDSVYTQYPGIEFADVWDSDTGFVVLGNNIVDNSVTLFRIGSHGQIIDATPQDFSRFGSGFKARGLEKSATGFFVAGDVATVNGNDTVQKILLNHFSLNGTLDWSKLLYPDSTNNFYVQNFLYNPEDKSILLTGKTSKKREDADTAQCLFLKLSESGDILLDKRFGGDGTFVQGIDIEIVGSQGYMIMADYKLGIQNMVVLIKTDENGEL